MSSHGSITKDKRWSKKTSLFIKAAKEANTHTKKQRALLLLGSDYWTAREAHFIPMVSTNPVFSNLLIEYLATLKNTPSDYILSWAGMPNINPKMFVRITKKLNSFEPSYDERGELESGSAIIHAIKADNAVLLKEFMDAGYPADALFFAPPNHLSAHRNLLDYANENNSRLCGEYLEEKGVSPLRASSLKSPYSRLPIDVDSSIFKEERYVSMFFDKGGIDDMPEEHYIKRLVSTLSNIPKEHCNTMLIALLVNNTQSKELSFIGTEGEQSALQSERWIAVLSNRNINKHMDGYFSLHNKQLTISPGSQPAVNLLLNMVIIYLVNSTSKLVHKSTKDFVLTLWNRWLENTPPDKIGEALPLQLSTLNNSTPLPGISLFYDALPAPKNDKELIVFSYLKGLCARGQDDDLDIILEDFIGEG
jgi:hypothetical protein